MRRALVPVVLGLALVGAACSSAASFTVEVWADNWAAVYANGELVGEDSVPITTERSFNAETPRTR